MGVPLASAKVPIGQLMATRWISEGYWEIEERPECPFLMNNEKEYTSQKPLRFTTRVSLPVDSKCSGCF